MGYLQSIERTTFSELPRQLNANFRGYLHSARPAPPPQALTPKRIPKVVNYKFIEPYPTKRQDKNFHAATYCRKPTSNLRRVGNRSPFPSQFKWWGKRRPEGALPKEKKKAIHRTLELVLLVLLIYVFSGL